MIINLPGKIIYRKNHVLASLANLLRYELLKMINRRPGSSDRFKSVEESVKENAAAWVQTIMYHVGDELYKDFGKSKNVKWLGRMRRTLEAFGWQIDEQRLSDLASRAFITSYENGVTATIQKFDWREGDYCDYGSCFFNSRSIIQELLNKIGVIGITFRSTCNDKPIGRCLAVQNPTKDTVFLFNFYSAYSSDGLMDYVAEVINPSGMCGRVALDANGILFINHNDAIRVPTHVFRDGLKDFPTGYSVIKGQKSWLHPDKDRFTVWYDGLDDYVPCAQCEQWCDRDDMYFRNGGYYCSDYCSEFSEEDTITCDGCGCTMVAGDEYWYNGLDYCTSCYNEKLQEDEDSEK